MAKMEKENQYIYIVQAALEPSMCKIGKTNDLDGRLTEYNNMTGKSKENIYKYLFTCEVKDMTRLENAVRERFFKFREEKSKEIYFYNVHLFKDYIQFIKSHKLFVKEIFVKEENQKQIVQIVKKTNPTLEERGLTRKEVMQKAQNIDNDEFYTRYEDVEKELSMYDERVWKNKTVFCNCDNAVGNNDKNTSAFPLYFLRNFKELGLKKLICTHYSSTVDLFNQCPKGYIFTGNGYREFESPQDYDGSFDHPLSLKILREEADIVCTNPPFSRAIDYWNTVINSGKKFLIISNIINVLNTAYIPYFMSGKVWAGYHSVNWYLTPKKELTSAAGHWYTNIPIKNRPKYKLLKIVPLKSIPAKCKEYDDSKTLLVGNCYIPSDYKQPFAVSTRPILNGLLEKGYKIVHDKKYVPYINEEECFARVLVQKK